MRSDTVYRKNRSNFIAHNIGDNCPACHSKDNGAKGTLQLRKGKFGDFLGCSRFPSCKYTNSYGNDPKKKKWEKIERRNINQLKNSYR